jgi:hypothetical protein
LDLLFFCYSSIPSLQVIGFDKRLEEHIAGFCAGVIYLIDISLKIQYVILRYSVKWCVLFISCECKKVRYDIDLETGTFNI